MKPTLNSLVLPVAAAWGLAGTLSAAVIHTDKVVMVTVPDASPSGLASQVQVAHTGSPITDVNITLTLAGTASAGGWTGDLYAWLGHEGTRAVLLNRPGRTSTEALGYDDDSLLAVSFDDQAVGDVHVYQVALGYAPGWLTGSWQPDGRDVDPALAVDTDVRTLGLSGFNGMDPWGDWTLFVADLSGGGMVSLVGWQLDITVAVIPEPLAGGALAGAVSLAWVWRRRATRALASG